MSNKQTDEQGKPLTYWGGLDKKMSNKQSSIKWFDEQLCKRMAFEDIEVANWYLEIFNQAKEMHKQEIYATFAYAYKLGYIDDGDNRIEYYNELFGK